MIFTILGEIMIFIPATLLVAPTVIKLGILLAGTGVVRWNIMNEAT